MSIRKLGKLARALATVASNPSVLGRVLEDPFERDVQARIGRQYGLGKGLPSIDLLDLVPGLAETIDPFCFMNGSSRTVDLALLKRLARRFPDCRYLEIGTLRGESLANVAEIAGECVSVSLSEMEMKERGLGGNYLKNNGFFLGGVDNVKRIGHDSATFDFSTVGKFDLIFVDGDHSYEGVKKDTENAFGALRDANSIIVWHDYGVEYESPCWRVMAGILDGAPSDQHKAIYHVSNTLCAIYIQGQFETSVVEHPAVPNKVFSVRVEARRLTEGQDSR